MVEFVSEEADIYRGYLWMGFLVSVPHHCWFMTDDICTCLSDEKRPNEKNIVSMFARKYIENINSLF